MVAAKLVAELLSQVVLRPPRPRVGRSAVRLNARWFAAGCRLLLGRDELLPAHHGKHDVAARERTVIVGPRRQRRGRAQEPGNECGLRERQGPGGLSIEML